MILCVLKMVWRASVVPSANVFFSLPVFNLFLGGTTWCCFVPTWLRLPALTNG